MRRPGACSRSDEVLKALIFTIELGVGATVVTS